MLFLPFTVLGAAALASARPLASCNIAGAAFSMSNDNDINAVLIHAIGLDGKVSFAGAVSSRGTGSQGVSSEPGPDPLFSQGSLKATDKFLLSVNAGSNTLIAYNVNKACPTQLEHVGQTQSTGGEFPMSITFSEKLQMACVLNGGAVDGVACFKVSNNGIAPVANTVRPIGLNQTTPPAGPAGTTSQIVFSEDSTTLTASIKGVPPKPGFLATWTVDAKGGLSETFARTEAATGGLLPFSMTNIPNTKAIVNTDAGDGFSIYDFSTFDPKTGKGVTSSNVAIAGQKATCWSAFSKATGNFYLTDIGTSTVTEINVSPQLKGAIVQQYPLTPNSGTIDNAVANIGAKDFLYVLSANKTSVDVLSLDAPGKAKPLQTFNFASAAARFGVKANPNKVQGMTVFMKS